MTFQQTFFTVDGVQYATAQVTDQDGVVHTIVTPALLDDVNDKVRSFVEIAASDDTVAEGEPSGYRGYQLSEKYGNTPSTYQLNSMDFWGGAENQTAKVEAILAVAPLA